MPKQSKPAPKEGAFRRDRTNAKARGKVTKSGSIVGKITKLLWGKKGGWDSSR